MATLTAVRSPRRVKLPPLDARERAPARAAAAANGDPVVPAWGLTPLDVEALAATMIGVARSRYRLRQFDAEDAVQEAFLTFLEIRHRYPRAAEHPAIIVGILKKKCLEHIGAAKRDRLRLQRYCEKPDAARENAWIRPGHAGVAPAAVEEVVRAEERELTLDAIRNLKPEARRLTRLITWHEFDRQELIERLELNKNTLDSRLRSCRTQLRRLLNRRGLSA